jgi:hypothetical protein
MGGRISGYLATFHSLSVDDERIRGYQKLSVNSLDRWHHADFKVLIRGCILLLEGEDEIPFASESTKIRKYFDLSSIPPGPANPVMVCSLEPPAQVGIRIAFDLSVASVPTVR